MNPALLYLLLLKATLTSFSGLASLPMVRSDLVVERGLLTDTQLNAAVAAARAGPGPSGLYVVNVGYLAGGIPGAAAGWAALVTPSFLAIALLRRGARYARHPEVRGAIRGVLLCSAGLLLASAWPLGKAALRDWPTAAIAAATFAALAFTRVDTLAVIALAAAAGMLFH